MELIFLSGVHEGIKNATETIAFHLNNFIFLNNKFKNSTLEQEEQFTKTILFEIADAVRNLNSKIDISHIDGFEKEGE